MKTSHRVTSKGSSRGAGPKVNKGVVRVRDAAVPDTNSLPVHSCGLRMRLCFGCGEAYCAAPGHVPHRCNEE